MPLFRIISLLEGISYLVILCVSLGVIPREFVFPLGMAHGVLFMAYVFSSLHVSHQQNWSLWVWLAIFMAALVPFAFVAVEFFLRNSSPQNHTA